MSLLGHRFKSVTSDWICASTAHVHFWPFDGWSIPAGRSALVEVYPALWSRSFHPADRTPDQHDAYSIVAWFAAADSNNTLPQFLHPELSGDEQKQAEIEGWILGVA